MRTFGFSALLLLACGGPPPAPPAPPPPMAPAPQVLRPEAAGATHYLTPSQRQGVHERIADRIVFEARRAARSLDRTPPELDVALTRAAQALTQIARGGETPSPETLAFAASHFGLIEPLSFVVVIEAKATPIERVAEGLASVFADALRRKGFNRIGVGARLRDDGATTVYVVALVESRIALTRLPRRLPPAGVPFEGELDDEYDRPVAYLADPKGQVHDVRLEVDHRRFTGRARCTELPGVHRLEVMATGDQGPKVLANFPLWCAATPPTELALAEPAAPDTGGPEGVESELHAEVNAARAEAGLHALRWDEDAAAVARAHSRDMVSNDFLAHQSPSTGSAADRVKSAGLASTAVMENVATAPDATQLHEGLMNSPGHRAAILSPQMTRLGVGVARRDADNLVMTQLFLDDPPKRADPVRSRAALLRAIATRRAGEGLPALKVSERLDGAAHAVAAELAGGIIEPDEAGRAAVGRIPPGVPQYLGVRALVGAGDPTRLANSTGVADPRVRDLGVGVVEGVDRFGQPSTFTVVLLGVR